MVGNSVIYYCFDTRTRVTLLTQDHYDTRKTIH